MDNLFFDIRSSVDIPGAPTIPRSETELVFPPPVFDDAIGQWRLGGSAASLLGLVGDKSPLVDRGAAAVAYSDGYAVLSNVQNGGLRSNIHDNLPAYTLATLCRRPALSDAQIIMGSLVNGTGSGVFWQAGTIRQNTRSSGGDTPLPNLPPPASLLPGSWYVVVLSQAPALRQILAMDVDGHTTTQAGAFGVGLQNTAGYLGVGRDNYSSGIFNPGVPLNVAEFAIWNEAKTAAEMASIADQMLLWASWLELI